jgi:acetylornithine deacetylase/succinyl-diaminopimelate desuccinylase-like protein
VAIAGMHGIPCLGLGPGDEVLAHAPDEYCPVDHLDAAAAFYAGLIHALHAKSE